MADKPRPAAARRGFSPALIPRWLVYLAGFVPAILVFYAAFTDAAGADPVRTLEHTLGIWALRFLVAGLAVTPLRQLTGLNLLRFRRALGLLAFYYAALHLGVYLMLDRGLDAAAIWADIYKRWYITLGFAAFVLLVPLAATSTNAAIRTLGGKAWAKLHRLVYAAAILAAVHFVYVMKVWAGPPLVYSGLVILLLGYRLVRGVARPARPRAGPPAEQPARLRV